MDLLAPLTPRYDSNQLPHRAGPRDMAAAAGAASLAGMISLVSLFAQSTTSTDPAPVPAVAALPVPAA